MANRIIIIRNVFEFNMEMKISSSKIEKQIISVFFPPLFIFEQVLCLETWIISLDLLSSSIHTAITMVHTT